MKQTWEQVDEYITDLLCPNDSILDDVLVANRQADLPEIDVTGNQGKLLQLLVQMQGAKRVLEIGTLGAYSTIWMARGWRRAAKSSRLSWSRIMPRWRMPTSNAPG
ncbi:O-methyltransferase [Paenibacillus sp. P1XP2]|nr:O-methyltransferase [Paenibacillus sp. P1XP2]